MNKDELQKHLETENVEFRGTCHDCNASVNVLCAANEDGEIVVSGGAIYTPKTETADEVFFKCDTCFAADKTLRKWRPCEIYSRVVGYLRPVTQYNKGKRAEYEMRKEFIINSKAIKTKVTEVFTDKRF